MFLTTLILYCIKQNRHTVVQNFIKMRPIKVMVLISDDFKLTYNLYKH